MSVIAKPENRKSTVVSTPVVSANAVIESIGVYLPPEQVETSDIMAACRHKLLYPLERLTGIKTRRMAGKTEFAIDLAINAIRICLDKSQHRPEDIDLLVCCNISRYDAPNFHFSFEPSTSARLREHFGMTNAMAFDISNACAGMFTGVNVADAFIKAGFGERVMVVSGEYITHLTDTAQKEICEQVDSRVACLTLGDSGAAMILERSDDRTVGFHEVDMFTLGKYSDLCIARPTYSEHGGAIMFTQSVRLHAIAISRSVAHVVDMARRTNWLSRFQHFIMHQTARTAIVETGQKINQFLREEILDRSNIINNLAERGNTSTTTHFVAVWDNILNNRINDTDDVMFAIQASGITIGTAPYTFDDLPARLRSMESGVNARKRPAGQVLAKRPVGPGARVRMESVATLPLRTGQDRDAIALAARAGEACLKKSQVKRCDVGLLIHSGVYRNEFICEPALAAIIAGEMHLNDDAESAQAQKTFAFDVLNGAVGFLDACRTASAMLRAGKVDAAMVCTSEIENNADYFPEQLLGVQETGSAMILARNVDDMSTVGFGAIRVDHYPQYMGDFSSWIGQDRGRSFLSFIRDPEFRSHMLACLPVTIDRILTDEGLTLDDIDVVVPPLVSAEFAAKLARRLKLSPERVIMPPAGSRDLYTSSIPYGLAECQRLGCDKPGNIALLLVCGSGIQVGAAIYHF